MPVQTPEEILLCEYADQLGRHQLYAVLDELSLTYRVAIRYPDGRSRPLREHVPSRLNALKWAEHYRHKQLLAAAAPRRRLTSAG